MGRADGLFLLTRAGFYGNCRSPLGIARLDAESDAPSLLALQAAWARLLSAGTKTGITRR